MLGHDCLWRRCTCRDCGNPMRNRAYARKLRRARRVAPPTEGGPMHVMKRVPPYCGCQERVKAFAAAEAAAGRALHIGSQVQCDCGKVYQCQDDQRDGLYWQHILSPRPLR